ncbi:MAG: hypothetical protein AB2A00_42375 [Myxococcota bacterium]
MQPTLALMLALAAETAGPVDDQPWRLDAKGAVVFSSSRPGEGGVAEVSTKVLTFPNPFRPSQARILRADGTEVKVGEGLANVGWTDQLARVASSQRSAWTRAALVFTGLTAVGSLGFLTSLAVLVPAVWWSNQALNNFDPAALRGSSPLTVLGMAGGPLLTALGVVVLFPACVLGAIALRGLLGALGNAWDATPNGAADDVDWPVDVAARVVEEHNRRLRGREAPGTPDEAPFQQPAPEQKPEEPGLIPSSHRPN